MNELAPTKELEKHVVEGQVIWALNVDHYRDDESL